MTEFINKSEKKKILEKLEEQYGIHKLDFLLVRSGQDKVRGFTGSLSKNELAFLAREINIEIIGLYLLKEENGLRLSFDATQILSGISKNIVEINEKHAEDWLKGNNIDTKENAEGFVIIKYKNDFLGCGKLSQGRITNFVPKERRIKN